jgi:hypothetical protein
MPDGERITLEFVALADDVPAEVRVRSLLKRALRSFKLECVRVVGLPASWSEGPDAGPGFAQAGSDGPEAAGEASFPGDDP